MNLRLFQYAILLHPDEDLDEKQKTKILKDPSTILAGDDKQAAMRIAREIPEEHLDDLDRVEILIRPF